MTTTIRLKKSGSDHRMKFEGVPDDMVAGYLFQAMSFKTLAIAHRNNRLCGDVSRRDGHWYMFHTDGSLPGPLTCLKGK